MAEPKTKRNATSVAAFLNRVENEERRKDCRTVLAMMKQITGSKPAMWGTSIVGFGSYHYVYASGREGDWPLTGFSPRKQDLTLYIMAGFDRYKPLMAKLGKYRTGKSCLYVKRIADIDLQVLKRLVTESVRHMRKAYA